MVLEDRSRERGEVLMKAIEKERKSKTITLLTSRINDRIELSKPRRLSTDPPWHLNQGVARKSNTDNDREVKTETLKGAIGT